MRWVMASCWVAWATVANAEPRHDPREVFSGTYHLIQSGKIDVVESHLKSCAGRGRAYLDKQTSFDVVVSASDQQVNGEAWKADSVVTGTLFMHRLEPVGDGRAVLSLQWVKGALHAVINYVELDSRGRYVCDDHGNFMYRDATP